MNCELLAYVPENDLALANGLAQYTPPPAAWRLHTAGEALPLWYGLPGDKFLSWGISEEWLASKQHEFGIGVDVASHGDYPSLTARPWGWSPYTRSLLRENCPGVGGLPDDARLSSLRRLSHRRTSLLLNQAVRESVDIPLPPPAREIDDAEVLAETIAGGRRYIKQPWSSSGRGIIDTLGQTPEEILRQCRGVIRRQGSVIVEDALDRAADFAVLFESRGGCVRAVALSWFQTVRMGEYAGNLLAPQRRIQDKIIALVPAADLERVVGTLEKALSRLVGQDYEGFLGIDMMAYRHNGQTRLAPCVELNLRMTMGVVAWRFASQYLAPGSEGILAVSAPAPDGYTSSCGRLVSGRMTLSPPSGGLALAALVHEGR